MHCHCLTACKALLIIVIPFSAWEESDSVREEVSLLPSPSGKGTYRYPSMNYKGRLMECANAPYAKMAGS